MRFASFRHGGEETYGVLEREVLIAAPKSLRADLPDLKSAIASGRLLEIGGGIMKRGSPVGAGDAQLRPVIPNPDKILCVGLNYALHREETGRSKTEHPVIFTRFADTLLAHGEEILKPRASDLVDYEGELAVIIGKSGRRIAPGDAWQHIAGYTCFNDVSVRDWQGHTHQYTPGKNFPATAPCGPAMVTADEIGDPSGLRIQTRVNGKVLQDARIGDMIFGIPEIVAYVSAFTELRAGDIIATGTPGGVGYRRDPRVMLFAGMTVEVEIGRIGTLRNPVADE